MSKFTDLCLCLFLLLVGCSETASVAGTAEEPNELAVLESSSSIEVVESSSDVAYSSSALSSSSEKAADIVSSSSAPVDMRSSSSSEGLSSSSEWPSSSSLLSSSSFENGSVFSSSSEGKAQSGTKPDLGSLEYYLAQFGLAGSPDDLLAGRSTVEKGSTSPGGSDTTEQGGPVAVTEFDGPWPHPFVKQNIGALEYFFPDAAREYADLINSIKDGSAGDDCRLYMLNVEGNSKSVGHMLGKVSEESIEVLNIVANGCEITTEGKMFRFLIRYCGELQKSVKIVPVTVEVDLPESVCSAIKTEGEWVK